MNDAASPLFPSPSLLIVDDDVGFVHAAAEIARMQGYDITVAGELKQAMHRVRQRDFDLALVDLDLPDGSGLSLLEGVDRDRTQAIIVTGRPTVESALQSFRNAVVDYLVKPISPERLRQLFESCRHHCRAPAHAGGGSWQGMVGGSDAFVAMRRLIEKVAPCDASVLVHGESGSGK